MGVIPPNLSRVPNYLGSQILLNSLNATNKRLYDVQVQLATGRAVQRPSDDIVAAATIGTLDSLIEGREQRLVNLQNATSQLNNLDVALGDATDMLLEAKSIGLSQIGVGSDAETRAAQAEVIDSILQGMQTLANRKYRDVHYFGGAMTGKPPIEAFLGGVRYVGDTGAMFADLGVASEVPITISGNQAFGALSARVEGDRDLDPAMVADTLITDLNGAGGTGVDLGTVSVDVNGTLVNVDLSEAHTAGDVAQTLQDAIQTVDPGATVAIAGSGNAFAITPAAGPITISDPSGNAVASDLGLVGTYPAGSTTAGADVDPRLTDFTPLSALSGVTYPLGSIRLENAGHVRDVDLSGVQSVGELRSLIHAQDIGIRVEINDEADRLDFINEVSGAQMSVGELAGGSTATELGVRTLSGTTLLADFNDGQGVGIVSGSVDPVTGLPDPAADLDFNITLKDGTSFDVDLAGATTVQDVLDAVNAAAAGAGAAVPADFNAGLAADGNGITLTDNTPGTDTTVTALNGSTAADDLGIAGTFSSASFTGEDRATVAVDGVFSSLIALRDALLADDEQGISFATQNLEDDIARVTAARGTVGARASRIEDVLFREEELMIQDESLRSQLRDLDYADAAVRFTQLQQQLQAGLLTASQLSSLSLLDFLG